MPDDKGQPYFFALGRSLADSDRTVQHFTRDYFLLLPAMIPLTGLLGWVLAGRAIRPLNCVAQAAQNITGSNLSLQIPLRSADDELDNLIDSFNRMTDAAEQNPSSRSAIFPPTFRTSCARRSPRSADNWKWPCSRRRRRTNTATRWSTRSKTWNSFRALCARCCCCRRPNRASWCCKRRRSIWAKWPTDVVDQFQIPAEEKHVRLTARLEPGMRSCADRDADRTADFQSAFQRGQVHARRRHGSGARRRDESA